MSTPYIGITGFTTPAEVAAALRLLPSGRRRLMVGVLASDRTLEGLPEEMHPRRHPPVTELPALFLEDSRAFNVVHFHTRTPEALDFQADRLIELAGPRLHGLQINLHQIPVEGLRAIRASHPGLRLIVPLRDASFRFTEESAGLVDVVLFDLSAGRGFLVDPAEALAALEASEASLPGVGLAVAGGLGPDTIDRVRPLLERFPDLSIVSLVLSGLWSFAGPRDGLSRVPLVTPRLTASVGRAASTQDERRMTPRSDGLLPPAQRPSPRPSPTRTHARPGRGRPHPGQPQGLPLRKPRHGADPRTNHNGDP